MIFNPEFSTMECCVCGILFAFSSISMEYRRKGGADVWCPNGHRVQLVKEGNR